MPETFSLLDEQWIACSMPDGSVCELSIRRLFDGSAAPVEIRGDSPTQDYAVLRLLLAIFWRAHRHEADVAPGQTFEMEDWFDTAWQDAQDGGVDEAVLTYLDEHRARFDLLDPVAPFMQVAGLRTAKDQWSPISRIIPEAESEFFTTRAGAGRESIGLAEAARWVVHTQAYDYSGIKSGAEGDPRVKGGKGYPIGTGWTGSTGGTVVLGSTLRETLVLNTVSACLRAGDADVPVWEREPDGPAERPVPVPQGPADLATWQSRRIRLMVEADRAVGVLVCNGDRIPDAGKDVRADPMTPYRFSANQTKKNQPPVYYARPHDTDRTMWRSLEPLIVLDGEQSRAAFAPLRPGTLTSLAELESPFVSTEQRIVDLRLISASYGPQASSHATTVDARIELPRAVLAPGNGGLRRAVLDTAAATQDAAVALGRYAGNLLVASGGEYSFQAAPTDGMLTQLEGAFRRWLRDLTTDAVEASIREWQDEVLRRIDEEAQVMLRGAGPKALIGREVLVNGTSQIRSAGSAYRHLHADLRAALPSATAHAEPTQTSTPDHQETNR